MRTSLFCIQAGSRAEFFGLEGWVMIQNQKASQVGPAI